MKRWFVAGLVVIAILLQPHPAQADDDLSETIAGLRASPIYVAADNKLLSDGDVAKLKALLQPGDHILIAVPPKDAAGSNDAQSNFTSQIQAKFTDNALFVIFKNNTSYSGGSGIPYAAFSDKFNADLADPTLGVKGALVDAIERIHTYQKEHPPFIPGLSNDQSLVLVGSLMLVVCFVAVGVGLDRQKRRRANRAQANHASPSEPPEPTHDQPPPRKPSMGKPSAWPGTPAGNRQAFNAPVNPWPGTPIGVGKPVSRKQPTRVLSERPHAQLTALSTTDPKRIWNFTIKGVIGAGGFGKVYAGVWGSTVVAIKVISPQVSHLPDFTRRFEREIATCHKLPASPHIVPLLHSQSGTTQPWLATKFVNALDLNKLVSDHYPGGLPSNEAIDLIREVALALESVHASGIVHRDIKPANILMPPEGAMVTDFGIARIVGSDVTLTATGVAIGTPAYMAPEYFLRESEPSAEADMFSFGATMYFAATGRQPFTGRPEKIMLDVIRAEPDYMLIPDKRVRKIIRQCMTKDPAMRPTATDVILALKKG
ncbi:MAG TPA: protein kinase [Candidatus Saccharimonas sp.]|nr:protein kinase [Candidatus Saccharimonas sp.]